ncbi:MAG: helix-hairpin-helix domain-containing protein, partial [Flavobacteriaceae bacterium]|nr:helix-hairpin-helix domain-containing protein [Flavobacteriaceae bacterium]
EGWLKDISDVYNLEYEKIAQLEGFGERSATKLEASIEKTKKNPIHKLLHSLSIHHLGKKASKLIAQEINHVLDLKSWNEEDFTNIKDIGPVVAKNVIDYFGIPTNIKMLEKMEGHGVNLNQTETDRPIEVADDAPLAGKTILFTGSLQKMGRKEAQELAVKNGAKNISAVSSNLDILVAGEKAGSKLKKATALGTVEIMSEDEFLELIK